MLTVRQAFDQLNSNLTLSNAQESEISRRQQAVRSAVADGFAIEDSFLTGSYRRSTAIPPLSRVDIDIFMVLAQGMYKKQKPSQLLDELRSILLKAYPNSPKISRNGQAVTISFTDFLVDVVPSFQIKDGGYLVPNSRTETWIRTDPAVHAAYLHEENRRHSGQLIPLVRMMKAWNLSINHAFSGFYLELLTAHILKNLTIPDHVSGLTYVFLKGQEAVQHTMVDPAGLGDDVVGLQGINNVPDAVKAFETAFDRAARALDFEQRGHVRQAFEQWRSVLGSYFPQYG